MKFIKKFIQVLFMVPVIIICICIEPFTNSPETTKGLRSMVGLDW